MERKQDLRRTANFTYNETKLLLQLVKKFCTIIESKKTDSATWREKEATWKRICEEFNSINYMTRSLKNLKCRYENIKKMTKKKIAVSQGETNKGDDKLPDLSMIDTMVIDVVRSGLDPYYEGEPVDLKEAGDATASESTSENKWNGWNPVILKMSPVSSCGAEGSEENVAHSSTLNGDSSFGMTIHDSGDVEDAEECTANYSTLNEARLELVKLQQEIARQDKALRKQEHDTRMNILNKEWELREEKLKLEILALKKDLQLT